ncbi:hypothetical protein [Paenibacillus albus]|uniref:Uncharacterized protein n=1 Tax=Paenibacillus albus TaxID=2495582 RepID=A0A3S9AB47_9BACL|nr:hypothetical protein [Paenibacillus albus]AZN42920.1 hypothetical protein EJC50_26900 [Paenibacillus albus]
MEYENIRYDDGDIGTEYFSTRKSFLSRWKAELIGEIEGKRFKGKLVYKMDENKVYCEQFTLVPVGSKEPVLQVRVYDDYSVKVVNQIKAEVDVCRREKVIKLELKYKV